MRLQLRSFAASCLASALLALLAPRAYAQEHPWTLSTDSSVYTDTDNVLIVTSQVGASRALDDAGGKASATALVDVVSAASVDVVAQASKRFDEIRGEANLAVSKAFGETIPSLDYRISNEADYLSNGFGGGLVLRLGTPDTVLSTDYHLALDTIGRSGTPFSTFSRSLTTHSADLGLTQTLSPRALLRFVYTLTVQRGYMEKVYRFVPLFDATGLGRARADGVDLTLESFDDYRLATRPPEEVPDTRVRQALALRGLYYLEGIDGSARADYRFYLDDWGMTAHTLELSLYFPIGGPFMLDVLTRGYLQSAADFYERAYVVQTVGEIPRYRTVDRKLSPYYAATLGSRVELELDPFRVYFEVSCAYTRFTDFFYLERELALIGQGGLSWTP